MMSDEAMFKATVHTLRTIPSRKVVQLVLEAPIEELPHVAAVCKHGSWMVVARLCDEQGEVEKPHRAFEDMSMTEQAGMLCNDPSFRRYLQEKCHMHGGDETTAASFVRALCRVGSRREIVENDPSGDRWQRLVGEYRTWQLAPRVGG